MKKFEYTYGVIYDSLDRELSYLGEEGWEIFSIEEREDNSYKFFAKREKIEEHTKDRYKIVNEFGDETYLHTNEIYVNIGNCAGDIWERSLWKKTFVDSVDKDGVHTLYGVFKEFIPSGLFKMNNLEYSLEHLHHIKNF